MSSAAAPADLPPVLPRPSIFISYASENRAAARLLRDTLAASGLDVWYDENELGGGDAWDQKIRRQIRECTYFMPVISAQTEARREGYFRREWRLAVDRSHDMADDVMFLLPVVIDGTSEAGARVPEKFLTVQWLKLPGGVATPALSALASRLAHGEHIAPTRAAAFVPPPPLKNIPVPPIKVTLRGSADAHAEGPPPMPHFPVRPADQRENLKYFAEILWWILTTAWLLFKRLPKWARILVVIWAIMMLFRSSDDPAAPHKSKPAGIKTVAALESKDAERLRDTAAELEKVAADPATGNIGAGFARAGAELAKAISKEVAAAVPAAGPLGVVPFNTGASEPAAREFADAVFERVFGQLTLARPGRVSVRPTADPAADDATLRALAAAAGEDRLLVARFETEAGKPAFVVRLLAVKTAKVVWTGTFEIDATNATDVAGQITQAVLKAHPSKPPAPPPAAP